MWPKRRRRPSPLPSDETRPLGNQFGWEVHIALQAWTDSVDMKSSIVVVVEAAVTAAATKALVTKTGEMHAATGLRLATAIVALLLLALAVALALWVVFPRLKPRRTAASAATGLIYFGHLRARSADDIERALAAMTPAEERRQLARQLQVISDVAWRKHSFLQASLWAFAVGSILLVAAFVAF
jgi:Family of unknown function (DUF5706)